MFPLREDLIFETFPLSSENLFILNTNKEAKPVHKISQIDTFADSSNI